jgi:hypothetical protein
MDVLGYFRELNDQTHTIFEESLAKHSDLGLAHHISACLFEFASNVPDLSERSILETVSTQIESATLSACQGMYRQAFGTLRLALEMGFAAAHFSANKIELQEWLSDHADIKWSSITDANNGVLSSRFARAFFPEFGSDLDERQKAASNLYRSLSTFVHGNQGTWNECGLKLVYNTTILDEYFKRLEEVKDLLLFVLCCRYLKSFSAEQLDSLVFISDEMGHLSYVREFFGGPKEDK